MVRGDGGSGFVVMSSNKSETGGGKGTGVRWRADALMRFQHSVEARDDRR